MRSGLHARRGWGMAVGVRLLLCVCSISLILSVEHRDSVRNTFFNPMSTGKGIRGRSSETRQLKAFQPIVIYLFSVSTFCCDAYTRRLCNCARCLWLRAPDTAKMYLRVMKRRIFIFHSNDGSHSIHQTQSEQRQQSTQMNNGKSACDRW